MGRRVCHDGRCPEGNRGGTQSAMGMMADTRGMTRDEWLAVRTRGLGGSDAAAVCGLDRWKSPMALYLEKRGEVEPEEPGEAAYWGTVLEDVVCAEFAARTALRVRRRNAVLVHPEHPWMLANVDREVLEGGHVAAILDAKTTSAWRHDDWEDGRIPDRVALQLHHYMAVGGHDHAYAAVLIGGQRFLWLRIERDDAVIASLIEIEQRFWDCVQSGTPPEVDGSDASAEVLARLYPEAKEGERVALPLDAEALIDTYQRAAADAKAAEARKQEAANRLKALLGAAEVGVVAGEERVTWKTIRGQRLDTEAIREAGLYERFARESITRRLTVR